MKRLPLIIVLVTYLFSLRSQNCIKGKVFDKDTKEAIVGAIVRIGNTPKAVFTDLDGNFSICGLAKGSYTLEVSYISYVNQPLNNIKTIDSLAEGPLAEVALVQEGKQLTEVTVSETKVTNTETSVVVEMRKSNAIVNTISAAQIQKSQDRDASEVVRRVPGVSIVDNRFIMVRGLADRYNNVWMNDAGAPSTETDKKSFSFDNVPSQLIDRILLYKTASPELPGDFAGGMVKIYTTAMPQKTGFVVNYQGSYRDGTTFQPYVHTQIYGNDWLGAGTKDRALPDVPNRLAFSDLSAGDKAALTNSLKNDWAIQESKARPDQRFSIGFNGLIKKGNFKFGSVTSLNYANTFQTFLVHLQQWDDTTQEADRTDIQSVAASRITGVQNFAAAYKNHKLEFRNFYTQVGQMRTTVRTSNLQKANNEKSYAEYYEQSSNYSGQLSGSHTFFADKTEYTWTAGYARNQKDVPNYKRITYTKSRNAPDSNYYAGGIKTQADITCGGIFSSVLKENIKSFNHNLKQKVRIARYEFELNAGNYFEYKSRTFAARELGYVVILKGPNASANAFYNREKPIETIFSPENLNKPGGFEIGDATKGYDTYNAQNSQVASYLSGNFPIGKHVKLQGGMRYEYNRQALQSNNGTDTVTPSITTKYWLPSVNLSYSFNYRKPKGSADVYKNIVRASYSKTLNRPEFREWAPLYFYDFEFGRSIYGSLYPNAVSGVAGSVLQVAEIQNYDLRYEFYPTPGEYIQIGGFYKSFTNPIVQVVLESGDPAFTFQNAHDAWARGVEIDLRKNLSFIDKWAGTGFFKNFSLIGNVSFIKSQMNNPNIASSQIPVTTLQNQSPYLYNGGIYYQNDSTGTQITLLYNVFGDRLAFVGTTDDKGKIQDGNIGEKGRKTLDLTISQKVFKKVSLTFGIQNILNAAYRLVQDTNNDGKYDLNNGDKEIRYYRMGAYYTAGIKVNF